MWPTKKLLFWALVATVCFFWNTTWAYANEETYFVATAYYSPLPGQSNYITWSYSGDIRLNGWGVTTASGKSVFPWLLAGPSNYPFWTKIYFEWYWIWSIEDRGWAIVKSWERWYSYDRLDIWMGYGDEWLERAIKWWKRTVKAKIVVPSAEISLKYTESPLWNIWNLRVSPDSEIEEVKKLQEIFKKIDIYSWEINGLYESIKNELIDFQVKTWIITWSNDEAAWHFGPKTIAILREKYGYTSTILNEEDISLFSTYNHKIASELYKLILEYGDLQVSPDSESDQIILLQELLTKLWEYSWNIDGLYSSVESSLIALQIKIWVIENKNTWDAGNFWNKTKTALFAYYENNAPSIWYILPDSEKQKISKALVTIKAQLIKQEKTTGKTMESRLKTLDSQIEKALPQVKDEILKAKLIYIQELI